MNLLQLNGTDLRFLLDTSWIVVFAILNELFHTFPQKEKKKERDIGVLCLSSLAVLSTHVVLVFCMDRARL